MSDNWELEGGLQFLEAGPYSGSFFFVSRQSRSQPSQQPKVVPKLLIKSCALTALTSGKISTYKGGARRGPRVGVFS